MARVSIGFPVYNGERYVAEALDAILSQDFLDFELLICDNASTDATSDICMQFREMDSRIRYHRNDANLGAAPNFNLSFEMASGEFFKWSSHDDLLKPKFLSACVAALDADRDAVLAYPKAVQIDESGRSLGQYSGNFRGTLSDSTSKRFWTLIQDGHNCFPVFGLVRREALAKTRLIGAYVGSDRVLLAQLGLIGRFVEISDELFIHREHSARSTRSIPLRQRAQWFDTRLSSKRVMPYWRFLKEYSLSVWRADLPIRDKFDCAVEILRWAKYYRKRLIKDLRPLQDDKAAKVKKA